MRRMPAIALLVALFAPGLAPTLSALTSDPEASLPACCRSHGAHHCVMVHWMLDAQNARPRFSAAPCPMYPAGATIPQSAAFTLAATPRFAAEPFRTSVAPAATARRAQLLLARTRRDRGPPKLVA